MSVTTLVLLELAPGADAAQLHEYSVSENRMVWDLYLAGTVRGMHMRRDRLGAVLELETADDAEAQALVAELPMVASGLLVTQLVGLAPFTPLEALMTSA